VSQSRKGFICPACLSAVEKRNQAFDCARCRREYPILFGIPDFRLRGDRYLSLEDERAKAGKLHDFARAHDFKQLVSYYYSITGDVPTHLEAAFKNYVLVAPERAVPALGALAPAGGRSLLDLGCGSGGALVPAARMFEQCTGVDIALRWLVIARKPRLRTIRVTSARSGAPCSPWIGCTATTCPGAVRPGRLLRRPRACTVLADPNRATVSTTKLSSDGVRFTARNAHLVCHRTPGICSPAHTKRLTLAHM